MKDRQDKEKEGRTLFKIKKKIETENFNMYHMYLNISTNIFLSRIYFIHYDSQTVS